MFSEYIDGYKDFIVSKTCELIRIPSVFDVCDDFCLPFGKGVNDSLLFMLDLASSLGFRTKNVDGYCGFVEFGSGDDLVGIVGHLDVVPAGSGWSFPPFSGTVSDGAIFGRGAVDDKGPVIASLVAMKAVMDNCTINKRVRLILGLNEENDWKCIEYYKRHEESPSIGFSPDSDFPCIYAEKSVLKVFLSMDYSHFLNDLIVIENIDCDNNAINVVPKFCTCTIRIDCSKISMNEFLSFLQEKAHSSKYEIDIYKLSSTQVKITCHGISAHAAHPDLGINAICILICFLGDIFSKFDIYIELFDLFKNYIGLDYLGKNLNINCMDDSGHLTLNVGNFSFSNNILKIGMDLRIPINTPVSVIEKKFLKLTEYYSSVCCDFTGKRDSLYIPKKSYLVSTLCNIFNKHTNLNSSPIAIGGATYARAFKNCVSFGPNFPGQKDMCHQVDEFIDINNLILTSKIYADAIYELSK